MQTFDFKGFSFRVVERDGEPWFVAADVCHDDALSLGRTAQSLRYLDDDERALLPAAQFLQLTGGTALSSDGRSMANGVAIISESGLYKLIMRSRKERAKPFVNWVTREVLPTLRKTAGSYIEPGSKAEFDLTDPDNALEAVKAAVRVAEEQKARAAALTEENDALRPRTVGAVGAESRKGGEPVWNLRDAVCDMLGVNTTQMYTQLRLVGAVEQNSRGKYIVKPRWSDLLFNSVNEVDGKNYPVGSPHVRPGKQAEFLSRVRDSYAFRFGVGSR